MALPEISRSMLKNALVLGLFAIATVCSVAVLQQATAERIAKAERDAQVRALSEILPQGSYDNHLLDNSIQLHDPLLGSKSPQTAYIALKDGQPSAIILRATAPDGYSGAIHLLIGIQTNGQLAGVRVLSHKETPKSAWIRSFDGKSLNNPSEDGWAVKKDRGAFDQFAGATITPRAVVKAVHKALQYFDANRQQLFANQVKSNG